MEKTRSQTYTLSLLLMNIFIAFLGISLVIPVMPTIMNKLHISGTVVGYLVSVFAFTQLIVSPIAGRMADQFGRKLMIVIGLFLFAVSEFLFGIGNTVYMLFASRVLGGISAAFVMPAVTAFIADITTLKTRPKALGYMSAAISTGFIIGPAIGGALAEFGHRIPFFTAAGLGSFAAVLSFISLREPNRNPENKTIKMERNGLKKILSPLFFVPFVIILISSFGLASFESLFSLFADHKFGFTPGDIAIMITGGAIIGAVTQIFLFDRMTIWWGEIRLIRYSLIVSAGLVFLMTVVNSYWTIMLVTFTVFVGFDLMRPAVTNYLSKIAGDEQGFVGGMNSMFTSLGNVFGPIVGGMLFDIDLNYPFYFATIIIFIGVCLTIFWKEPVKL
ncbi:multidrug efflux MFS transporter NorA [Fervidibacillus albus]|uniref:Multidrug efflux MFS transporter NorA n=1 Tax=Fervidibacillus albus TaxID=2980026 RepID=A0A9E8LSL9_9BACI|nr:multidrug efflux MFS transporter NorA [Fervidibacillus albus]WAA08845.1 multidrug efflux MFS transporter NorA [Fervidibacillus albus]